VTLDPLEVRGRGAPRVLRPGAQVAGYLLEEQIGAGGMAVVYRARDMRLDRPVALKFMPPAMAGDETFRLRFAREARAAAAVDDPHIIPVYEAGDAGGMLFIAMRFVSGGDLGSLLSREGPLSPHQVMSAISPVASALDAAHAAGLVHRDVKPANMLLDARPGWPDHVYLSDFGLSKGVRLRHLTGSGIFFGTPEYTAPEQIQGAAADGRTDQYALACSAFELLTGTVPFARGETWATVWAHLKTPPPALTELRPDLPQAVDAVLGRAMAKNPMDRYPSCREFADALRAALGSPAGATTGTLARQRAYPEPSAAAGTPRVRSRRRRRRTVMLAVAVLLVGAAVATALVDPGVIGSRAPAAGPGRFASTPLYGRIATFAPPRVPGDRQGATSVAFSPDGNTLAVGLTAAPANDSNDRTFGVRTYLYNVATGRQSGVLTAEGGTVAFSPDGKLLAASGGSGHNTVYLASAARPLSATAVALPGTMGKFPIVSTVFSPDGKLLAANDGVGDFFLWSTATRRLIPTKIAGFPPIFSLAFSPNGKTIVTLGLGAIYLWNVASGTLSGVLLQSKNAPTASLAYSPDGKLIAVTIPGGGVGLWDTATNKRTGKLTDPGGSGVDAVAFSPNSQILAAAGANGRIYLWDLRTRKLIATLVNPAGPSSPVLGGRAGYAVHSVAFSPNGSTLATSDTNGNAYLWRVR
jgi:Tol biopolymer transport system component